MPRTFSVDHERLAELQRTARATRGYERLLSEQRKFAQGDLEQMANMAAAMAERAVKDPTAAKKAAVAEARHQFYRTRRVGLENDARRIAIIANDFSNLAGLGELLLGRPAR